MELISLLSLEKIKSNKIKPGSPVSHLAFSGVKSTTKGRSARFGDIIHLASISDNVIGKFSVPQARYLYSLMKGKYFSFQDLSFAIPNYTFTTFKIFKTSHPFSILCRFYLFISPSLFWHISITCFGWIK